MDFADLGAVEFGVGIAAAVFLVYAGVLFWSVTRFRSRYISKFGVLDGNECKFLGMPVVTPETQNQGVFLAFRKDVIDRCRDCPELESLRRRTIRLLSLFPILPFVLIAIVLTSFVIQYLSQ